MLDVLATGSPLRPQPASSSENDDLAMASVCLDATDFLQKWTTSPRMPAPDDAQLRAVVVRVALKLSEIALEASSTATDAESLNRCAARLQRFLRTKLRQHETLATFFYRGERNEWILRLEEALETLERYLPERDKTTTSSSTSLEAPDFASGPDSDTSSTGESSNGEAWSATEKRARDFVATHYDYPRRVDPFDLRRMLLDLLMILEEIYVAGDNVDAVALKDLRQFLELDDRELVRTWPREQKHPTWIILLREATYVIRITLDLRTLPPTLSIPESQIIALSDHPPPLPAMRFTFPRHWRTTPLRIYPAALPPLPSISKRRHDQIFGSRHSSKSTAILVVNDSYRPLDFLGDALLGHLVSRILHKSFPHLRNGHLTYLRSLLVRNTTLSYLAFHYSFHTLIQPSRSLYQLDQKEMADLFEAFLGAVSLESRGEKKAQAWIAAVFCPGVFPEAGAVARQVANDKENAALWDVDEKPVAVELRQALEKAASYSSRAKAQQAPLGPLSDAELVADHRLSFLLPLDEQLAALRI